MADGDAEDHVDSYADGGDLQIPTVVKVGGRLASQLKGARGQVDICGRSDNRWFLNKDKKSCNGFVFWQVLSKQKIVKFSHPPNNPSNRRASSVEDVVKTLLWKIFLNT